MKSLQSWRWLPVLYLIGFKLCLVIHASVNSQRTEYIVDITTNFCTIRPCQPVLSHTWALRHCSDPICFEDRALSMAGPHRWKSLTLKICTFTEVSNMPSSLTFRIGLTMFWLHPQGVFLRFYEFFSDGNIWGVMQIGTTYLLIGNYNLWIDICPVIVISLLKL